MLDVVLCSLHSCTDVSIKAQPITLYLNETVTSPQTAKRYLLPHVAPSSSSALKQVTFYLQHGNIFVQIKHFDIIFFSVILLNEARSGQML